MSYHLVHRMHTIMEKHLLTQVLSDVGFCVFWRNMEFTWRGAPSWTMKLCRQMLFSNGWNISKWKIFKIPGTVNNGIDSSQICSSWRFIPVSHKKRITSPKIFTDEFIGAAWQQRIPNFVLPWRQFKRCVKCPVPVARNPVWHSKTFTNMRPQAKWESSFH